MEHCSDGPVASQSQEVYLPGDILPPISSFAGNECGLQSAKLILGPGVSRGGDDNLFATQTGRLITKKGEGCTSLWLECARAGRYTPVMGDRVIGVICAKLGDAWKVDIKSSEPATVSYMAFEGATRRSRPNLKVGDVIFCQVITAVRHMEPEVACIDSNGKSRGLGAVPAGGFMFNVPQYFCRSMLKAKTQPLKRLGAHVKFETAVGINGRIWLKAGSVRTTVICAQALERASRLRPDQTEEIDRIFDEAVEKIKGL